jgi:hypothetical protein
MFLDILYTAMARAPLEKIRAARKGISLMRKHLRAGRAVTCHPIELGQFYS